MKDKPTITAWIKHDDGRIEILDHKSISIYDIGSDVDYDIEVTATGWTLRAIDEDEGE